MENMSPGFFFLSMQNILIFVRFGYEKLPHIVQRMVIIVTKQDTCTLNNLKEELSLNKLKIFHLNRIQ